MIMLPSYVCNRVSSGSTNSILSAVVAEGVAIVVNAYDITTGAIRWSVWYSPLDLGAYVTVA